MSETTPTASTATASVKKASALSQALKSPNEEIEFQKKRQQKLLNEQEEEEEEEDYVNGTLKTTTTTTTHAISIKKNYGDSSRGRHGREYFDDDGLEDKSVGRQHGSFNYLSAFAERDIESMSPKKQYHSGNNRGLSSSYFNNNEDKNDGENEREKSRASSSARTIPNVHVHAEIGKSLSLSRSFENLDMGGHRVGSPLAPGSPVIVVHTNEMDEDAGKVGLAGGRNRSRSFSSLLLLEAQDLRESGKLVGSPRNSRLSGVDFR